MSKRVRNNLLFFLIFIVGQQIFAQGIKYENVFWRLLSYSGAIGLQADYRQLQTIFNGGFEEQRTGRILTGRISLDTKSYIWHPNLMIIDLNLDYYPGIQKDQFIVAPDRSEVRSLEKIYGRVTLFNERPVSLTAYYNYNHNYINRELTTDVDYYRKLYGTSLILRNDFLPARLEYTNDRWRQFELQTNREFTNKSSKIRAEVNKSFSSRDRGKLIYAYKDFIRTYAWNSEVHNKISSLNFSENIYFNERRTNSLLANIWVYNQAGTQAFDRLQAIGRLNYDLLWNLKFRANYNYFEYSNPLIGTIQSTYDGQLQHQLFESLTSTFSYQYADIRHTDYLRLRKTLELGFKYKKMIPTGHLRLFYNYRNRKEDWENRDYYLRVVDEEHKMNDDEIILLDYPYVNIESVVVTDALNSIIYEENVDYVLIKRDIYVEIQRIPGGRIAPGSMVYVDYIAEQKLDSKYTGITEGYGAGITLFGRLIEMYYRKNDLNYDNVRLAEYKILKVFNQQVFGVKFSFWRILLGYEHDDFKSNIVPYRSNRYYFSLNGYATSKLSYALSLRWRDQYLTQENELQNYAHGSIRFSYRINRMNRLNLDGIYRKQRGRTLDLDLLNLRVEFATIYRKIEFTLGGEVFRRDYIGQIQNYGAIFARLERLF